MEFNGRLEIKSTDIIKKNHGLQDMGPIQKFIDQECIRRMSKYTPRVNGMLIKSATLSTKIGSGKIKQEHPGARYLYHGILMVSPTTGSSWAKKHEEKVLTNTPLHYNGEPMRGKKWFERMKADEKEDILRGAQRIANRGGL